MNFQNLVFPEMGIEGAAHKHLKFQKPSATILFSSFYLKNFVDLQKYGLISIKQLEFAALKRAYKIAKPDNGCRTQYH